MLVSLYFSCKDDLLRLCGLGLMLISGPMKKSLYSRRTRQSPRADGFVLAVTGHKGECSYSGREEFTAAGSIPMEPTMQASTGTRIHVVN